MAKTKAPTYDADAEYSVKLTRPITIAGGRILRPINEQIFRGSYLKKIIDREGADVIDRANPI